MASTGTYFFTKKALVYGQNVIGQNGTNKTVPIKSSINLSIIPLQ